MSELVAYIAGIMPVPDAEVREWLGFLEKEQASPKMRQLADLLRRLWVLNRDQATMIQHSKDELLRARLQIRQESLL